MIKDKRGLIASFFLVFAFIFMIVALWRGWVQIAPYFEQLNFYYLLLAEVFIAIALVLGAATWHFIQKTYELDLSGFESARAHFASGITRYIPGYAWQYMSKAYLSGGSSEKISNISIALITEFGVLMLSGFFLLGVIALLFPTIPIASNFHPVIWWVSTCVGSVGIVIWFFVSLRILRWKHNILHKGIQFVWASVCSLLGWFSFGLATWYVILAFSPMLPFWHFPQVQFAVVASMLVSILVIFVPSGIGIRETALAFLLQSLLPLSMGIVVSILLRVGIILGELVGFLLISKGLRLFLIPHKPK